MSLKKSLRKIFKRKPAPSPAKGFITLHGQDHWKAYHARGLINNAVAYASANGSIAKLSDFEASRKAVLPEAIRADLLDICLIVYLIRVSRSQRVLEIGSGCSTVAILNSLAATGQEVGPGAFSPSFLSIDSDLEWTKLNQTLIERFSKESGTALPTWFELRYSKASVIEVGEGERREASYSHDFQVDQPSDFIYVDGPALMKEARHSCDVMKDKVLGNQTVICVDGRPPTVELIRNFIPAWTVLEAPYPSNDTYLIHPQHPAFPQIAAEFRHEIKS